MLALGDRRPRQPVEPPGPRAIASAALVVLAILPASYLARLFPLEERGAGFYWTFLIGVGRSLPTVAAVVARRAGTARAARS